MGQIINGREIATNIKEEIKEQKKEKIFLK